MNTCSLQWKHGILTTGPPGNFRGTSRLFLIMAAPIYIPTSSEQGFSSFIPSLIHALLIFLMIVLLTGVRSYLIVFLICISLIVSGIEHLSMFLLAISVSSLEKYLLTPSAYFQNIIIWIFLSYWVVYIFFILTACQMDNL